MFAEYIQAALERVQYKIVDNPEPVFWEVPELEGVWSTGRTMEDCRRDLIFGDRGLDCLTAAHG